MDAVVEDDRAAEDFVKRAMRSVSGGKPEAAAVAMQRSQNAARGRRLPEAVAICDEVLKLAPDWAAMICSRASSLWYSEQWVEAVGDYTRALELEEDSIRGTQ